MSVIGGFLSYGGKSKFMLCRSEDMSELATVEGSAPDRTNLGRTLKIVGTMVTAALEKASLDKNTKLRSLCFALEGTEIEEDREYFAAQLKRVRPNLSETYTVVSDAVASLVTANGDAGGMIVVAKRRSGSLYMKPDGSILRCGGYGHILSNEGSAVWISMRAIKTYLDHTDNNPRSDLSVDAVERVIFGHFGIKDRFDLLVQFYPEWDAAKVASMCEKLSRAAEDDGDELCLRLFDDAGKELAMLVAALADKAEDDGHLSVLCIGSVWDSWDLLRDGFLSRLREKVPNHVRKVSLMRLRRGAEFGACYLGAKADGGVTLPEIDFSQNKESLHSETL